MDTNTKQPVDHTFVMRLDREDEVALLAKFKKICSYKNTDPVTEIVRYMETYVDTIKDNKKLVTEKELVSHLREKNVSISQSSLAKLRSKGKLKDKEGSLFWTGTNRHIVYDLDGMLELLA